jgi:hypothetical protein
MDVVHERAAGVDISKRDAKVAVRVPGKRSGSYTTTVKTFGATTAQILALGVRGGRGTRRSAARRGPRSALAPRDKNASPHTIACYRDTLRLLLVFLAERTGTAP